MPVTTIAAMPHGLATHLSAMVEVHQEVAGFAAASASWSTGLRAFWGDNRGTW
jgi:hypothetical protein